MTPNPPPIVLYKCSLCPRCMFVRRELNLLRLEYPELEVEEIDVVLSPLRAWRNGIRMIPALQAGDALLSGLILKSEDIRQFVAHYLGQSVR